jgi:uncharacterized protein involved in copper resistance
MTKKTYIAPTSSLLRFHAEGLIATSLIIDSSKSGSQQDTRRGGWDSSNWWGDDSEVPNE